MPERIFQVDPSPAAGPGAKRTTAVDAGTSPICVKVPNSAGSSSIGMVCFGNEGGRTSAGMSLSREPLVQGSSESAVGDVVGSFQGASGSSLQTSVVRNVVTTLKISEELRPVSSADEDSGDEFFGTPEEQGEGAVSKLHILTEKHAARWGGYLQNDSLDSSQIWCEGDGPRVIRSHLDIVELVGDSWTPPEGASQRVKDLIEKAQKEVRSGLAVSSSNQ